MATVTTYSQLTLYELAKRIDPKGDAAKIAEILQQQNEILRDAVWQPANTPFANKTVRRASLPTGTWRQFNAGVTPSQSSTIEIWDNIGSLEDYLVCDAALAKGFPGPQKERGYRQQEAVAFLEGLSQTFASTFIYGNATSDPTKFMGLAPRLNSLTTANVQSCGGSGSDLTSIYVVQWGLNSVHFIYPPGEKMTAVQHRDLGEQTWKDANGNPYQAYVDHFKISAGLVVKDPKAIGRVCNIETTGTSYIFDEDKLITVLNKMRNGGRGAVIYVNPTVRTQMEIALKDKTNVNYTAEAGEGLAGEVVLRFRGCPVRTVEQIVDTESAVS